MLLALKDIDVNCKDDKGRSLIINEIRRIEWNEEYLNMLVVEKKALVN